MPPGQLAQLFASLFAVIGPAPRDMTNQIILKPGDRIVAIGDSITAAGGYLHDVDAVLAARYPDLKIPPIINAGIGGQVAEDLVPRFRHDVIEQKPAVVTISIGINDVWGREKEPHDPRVLMKYSENVSKMVEMAQAAGIKVILLTPTIIREDPCNTPNQWLTVYVDAEKRIAQEKKCGLADLHRLFLQAVAKKPQEVKGNWLTDDGVHMNPRGDALMAIGVLRALGVPDEKIKLADSP